MGKGAIISGGTDGLYQVQITYNRDRYNATITALNAKKADYVENRVQVQSDRDEKDEELGVILSDLNLLINELISLLYDLDAYQTDLASLRMDLAILEGQLKDLQDSGASPEVIAAKQAEIVAKQAAISDKQTQIAKTEKEIDEKQKAIELKQIEANTASFELALLDQQLAEIDLQITAIEKRVQYLTENMPEDETAPAWCADLTEDISGVVGTIEIPGERGILQIQPGYEGNAAYAVSRDGQLFPTISLSPAQAFYNAAMMPGWQKWKPIFRHGTISNIDTDADTGDVDLDSVQSSQQNLEINQASNISGVPIEYMNCNGTAFADGDSVLVMFTGNDFANPKIIGFKEAPKACGPFVAIKTYNSSGTHIGMTACVNPSQKWEEPFLFVPIGDYEELDDKGVYANRATVEETEGTPTSNSTGSGTTAVTLRMETETVQVYWYTGMSWNASGTDAYTMKVGDSEIKEGGKTYTSSASYHLTAPGSVGVYSPGGDAITIYEADHKADYEAWVPDYPAYAITTVPYHPLSHTGSTHLVSIHDWNATHIKTSDMYPIGSKMKSSFETESINDGGVLYVEYQDYRVELSDFWPFTLNTTNFPNYDSSEDSVSTIGSTKDEVILIKAWGGNYAADSYDGIDADAYYPRYEPVDADTYKYGYNSETEEEDRYKVFLGSFKDALDSESITMEYVRICGDVEQYAPGDRLSFEFNYNTGFHPIDVEAVIDEEPVDCFGIGTVALINILP